MGVITHFVYAFLFGLTASNVFALTAAIIVAVLVYSVLLLLFKGLNEEELRRFPKGASLVRLAKKIHLMK